MHREQIVLMQQYLIDKKVSILKNIAVGNSITNYVFILVMAKLNKSFIWGTLFASLTWTVSLYLYWGLNSTAETQQSTSISYSPVPAKFIAKQRPYSSNDVLAQNKNDVSRKALKWEKYAKSKYMLEERSMNKYDVLKKPKMSEDMDKKLYNPNKVSDKLLKELQPIVVLPEFGWYIEYS